MENFCDRLKSDIVALLAALRMAVSLPNCLRCSFPGRVLRIPDSRLRLKIDSDPFYHTSLENLQSISKTVVHT